MSIIDGFIIAGLNEHMWWDMFKHSHHISNGVLVRDSWPDGKCYLDQYSIVVVMFEIMSTEAKAAMTSGKKHN